jgi:hypothetical protein
VTSATADDFSWELISRLVMTAPRPDLTPERLILLPGFGGDAGTARTAVVLARGGVTRPEHRADVHAALERQHIPVTAEVTVTCGRYRWRRWQRYAKTMGIWRDPDRPWPVIDVLEEENARMHRGH